MGYIPFDDENDDPNGLAGSCQTHSSSRLQPGLLGDMMLDHVVEQSMDFEESDYESEIGDNHDNETLATGKSTSKQTKTKR